MDANIRSSAGKTPLHMARDPALVEVRGEKQPFYNHIHVITTTMKLQYCTYFLQVLLLGGAAVNACDQDGNTALHAAAGDAKSSPELIRMLVRYKRIPESRLALLLTCHHWSFNTF